MLNPPLTKNPQEFPESKLKELADLGNVRWQTLRLRIRRGGTAFYIHGAHCADADIDADSDIDDDADDDIAANIDAAA